MEGFLWFLLDVVLSIFPALGVLLIFGIFFQICLGLIRYFVEFDSEQLGAKVSGAVFFISWLLCIWVSTQVEGFPFPYLFGARG